MNDDSGKDTESYGPRTNTPGRGWWILGALVFLQALAVWGVREYGIHSDMVRWEQYQKAAAARGEDLELKEWAPPEIANEADNFALHPVVRELWDSPVSPASKQLEEVKSIVTGFVKLGDPPDAAQATKLLEDLKPVEGLLTDLHTAALRSGCRFPLRSLDITEIAGNGRMERLSELDLLLFAHARASLLSGHDEEAAVADMETLLRVSAHLRTQRSLMLAVSAMVWENQALEVIEGGLEKHQWSAESKARLRAALAGPEWPQALCETLRVERGIYLRSYDASFFASVRRQPTVREYLFRWFYPDPRIAALNKRILCEGVDSFLSSGGSSASAEMMFQQKRKSTGGLPAPDSWAGAVLWTYGSVCRGVLETDGRAKETMSHLSAPATE